jgi:hypothetical protein
MRWDILWVVRKFWIFYMIRRTDNRWQDGLYSVENSKFRIRLEFVHRFVKDSSRLTDIIRYFYDTIWTIQSEFSMPSNSVMLCSPAQQPLYTLTWKYRSLFLTYSSFFSFISFFISLIFPSSCALFHTFISERDCTPLQCLYKGCIQWNQ